MINPPENKALNVPIRVTCPKCQCSMALVASTSSLAESSVITCLKCRFAFDALDGMLERTRSDG